MEKEWRPRVEGIDFPAILKARGIKEEDIPMFVDPSSFAKEVFAGDFANLITAVNKVMTNNGLIMVVADVDADGLTSGAIIYNALRRHGFESEIIVGHGKTHGITQHLQRIIESGCSLLIACDSGSNEHKSYAALREHGIEIILLDHHGVEQIPQNVIVVNPEIWLVERSQLSGAGVCLKFVEMLEEFRDRGKEQIPYDLAAVGIIADVMDMRYEDNRAICAKGFDNLRNNGLKAALQGYDFNATSVRFSIAPLVNAAQRMGKNELALELFLDTTPPERCQEIVNELKELKEKQKERISETLAKAYIENHGKFIIATVARNEETAGLSGLIATNIAKDMQKPTIFVQNDGNLWQGSIRSYGVTNFKTIINETGFAISEGHEEAAGIKIQDENLNTFLSSLEKTLPQEQKQVINVDAEIDDVAELTLAEVAFIDKINKVTGEGFEPITIMVSNVSPTYVTTMKGRHTKINCANTTLLKWNDTKPADDWDNNKWKSFDIIGEPTISHFRGKESINIIINEIDYEVST